MQKQALSLVHELRQPLISQPNPTMLLMLHGYGSHEGDLFSFADQLPPEYLVVSARAPVRLPWGGYCWYDIRFDEGPSRWADSKQALLSLETLHKFIVEAETAYQTKAGETMLMGFSQGAILSYAYAFKFPDKVRNILALSGYMFPEIMPKQLPLAATKKLDFFVSHGTEDPVIPLKWAQNAVGVLETSKLKHVYREYPMGHGITPEAFRDILNWIQTRPKH
jgi:phospholipase/carboxylesterase